jgi:hypothetical protein
MADKFHKLSDLYIASNLGNAEEVRSLLAKGVYVNLQETYGQTPLHICKTAEVAKALIEADADLTRENNGGDTPYEFHCFMYCRMERDESRVDILDVIANAMNEQGISYKQCVCGGDTSHSTEPHSSEL